MYSTAPTVGEIRTAQANAVGGGRKRCTKGKNCSAACIQNEMYCLVDLPESAGVAVGKVRNYLMGARDKFVGTQTPSGTITPGEFQPLRTAKEAADWLMKNKDELAMWGIDDNKARAILKEKPKYITVGVEPGGGKEGAEKIKQIIPHLQNLPVVRDPNTNKVDVLSDELQKANNYKLALELSNYLSQQNPELFGKGFSQSVGDRFVKAGLDPDTFIKFLENDGLLTNGMVKGVHDPRSLSENRMTGSWGRKQHFMAEAAGIGNTKMGVLNPSGLWKPMEGYSQFGELFRQAGYSPEQTGPFKDQKSWLAYSANSVKERMGEIINEAKPNLLYVSQKNNDPLVNVIANATNGKSGSFTLSAQSDNGNPLSTTLRYFLHNHPDGSRTTVLVGPHSSMLGFKGQENFVKAAGMVVKSLNRTGELPPNLTGTASWKRPVSLVKVDEPGSRIAQKKQPTPKKPAKQPTPSKLPDLAKKKPLPEVKLQKVVGGREISDSQFSALYKQLGAGKSPGQAAQEMAKFLRIPVAEVKARLEPSKVPG